MNHLRTRFSCPGEPGHLSQTSMAASRTEQDRAGLANHDGSSDRHLPCFGCSPHLAGCLRQSERVWDNRTRIARGAALCKATSEGAQLRVPGSTFSTSAAIVPSAAMTAAGDSGSSGDPRSYARHVAASCKRPRSAGARPRAALLLVSTARRSSPASSPHWRRTPTCCDRAATDRGSLDRVACRSPA